MGVRFSGFVSGATGAAVSFSNVESELRKSRSVGTKLLFLSHKTNDPTAEALAEAIGKDGVDVYMAEWDDDVTVDPGNEALPSSIMKHIHRSDGFLVNANEAIRVSMWVGYEIGGAHALQKQRAKFMRRRVVLPSVVAVLETLDSYPKVIEWVRRL